MHQAHNIPWQLVEANFKLVQDDKRFTPPRTGIMSKNRAEGPKELRHFIKKFVQAIQTFSTTERAKYPAKLPPMRTGNVFSDELLAKHPEFLSKKIQPIEAWFARAEDMYDGELMDAVNVLLAENEMETLLMLAQHPQVHMRRLRYHSWGHHFGWVRSQEAALSSYLFFNSAESVGALIGGEYTKDDTYRYLVATITQQMDYCGQQVPHRRFFSECGALEKPPLDRVVHEDYGRLQAYLKEMFAVLYRFDVLARECGIDPKWEQELGQCYPLALNVEMEYDENAHAWVLA